MQEGLPITAGGFVARLAIEVAAAAAERRMFMGRNGGDGPAPSLATIAVTLCDMADGARVAERRIPAALSRYHHEDGRRLVCQAYMAAVERIGAARGADLLGDRSGGSSGVSDGGAGARVDDVAFVRLVRSYVSGAKWIPADRAFGPDGGRIILPVRRNAGARRPISASALWDGVTIDGLSFVEILRRHGWSKQAQSIDVLGAAFSQLVGSVADRFGFAERCGLRRS